jgi:outer membrane protein assembly factor BamB
MNSLALAFVVAITGQTGTVAPTDTWPQWRGPTGDSVSTTANLPTHWSKTENVIWKTPLPGWGNSTPAIWKDAIFVTSQQDDDRLLALRIDRKTGEIIWQKEIGRGKPRRNGPVGNQRYHEENNMASPSPVTDGEHVWFHFGTGDLACLDFGGKEIWHINMTRRYGPYSIWWGHANSPVLVGELLISQCVQDPLGGGQSYVVALDKKTGDEKWFTKRDTGAEKEPGDSYTTPLVYQHDGKTEVIVYGGNVLDAYEPTTGKQLWHCEAFKGNRVISGPTLTDGVVYAVEGMKGPLLAVQAGGKGDVTESAVRWKYLKKKNATPDAASPVVVKGLVFLVTNDGRGICVDAAKGNELWNERVADQFRATPLVVGSKIYFFGRDGKTTVIEAAREYKVLAESDLGEVTVASPAVAGADLFIRTKENLYRIGNKGSEK